MRGCVEHWTGGGVVVHCAGLLEQPQEGDGVVVQPQEWLVGVPWSEHKVKTCFVQEEKGLTCNASGKKVPLLLEAVCVP